LANGETIDKEGLGKSEIEMLEVIERKCFSFFKLDS
jgi:hypothetical protein